KIHFAFQHAVIEGGASDQCSLWGESFGVALQHTVREACPLLHVAVFIERIHHGLRGRPSVEGQTGAGNGGRRRIDGGHDQLIFTMPPLTVSMPPPSTVCVAPPLLFSCTPASFVRLTPALLV